ncbi:MAG: ABC transporter permease [Actinobacteria bacterium]|nr:ABC transporter permease [Actinomycetota bacterium]
MTLVAELTKLRALPTPRVIAAVCFGLTLLVGLILLGVQPSDATVYRDIATGPASIFVFIASIVFGAWVFGVEFGQGTLRRVLTAEPRRGVVLAAKALVVVCGVAVFAAALMAFSIGLIALVASASAVELDIGYSFKALAAMTIEGTLFALLASAFTLLFRSYAGGMIASLAMVFVGDGLIGLWSAVRDYTFGASIDSIDAAFDVTDADPTFALIPSILIALAWVAAAAVPGVVRFLRGDFK